MSLLRKILFPVSVIYGFVVYLRNRFYDWGIYTSKSYKTPIICIGNLSAGGTGKTPMVELLITLLQENYKVAVLSRGYKRKSKGFILASVAHTVNDLGDEPYQLFSKFKKVIVAVDADRQNGIEILEQEIKPAIILLDDAFQHRKVKPGFSILLTAFDDLYSSDFYLPTGNLRDSKREAARADIVVVTKCPAKSKNADHLKIKQKLNLKPHQRCLFSYLAYDTSFLGKGDLVHMTDLKNKKITLVTGIANPNPLVQYLADNEISFEHLKFKDHHNFTVRELELIQSKQNVLTTEKDYMRLKETVNCNYITIKHVFFDNGVNDLKFELSNFINSAS